MKWQKALTKTELAHLREYMHVLSLSEFKRLRKAQAKMEADIDEQMGDANFTTTACRDCNMIEFKLKQAGKL